MTTTTTHRPIKVSTLLDRNDDWNLGVDIYNISNKSKLVLWSGLKLSYTADIFEEGHIFKFTLQVFLTLGTALQTSKKVRKQFECIDSN